MSQYAKYPSTGGGVGGVTIGGTVTGGTPGSVLFVGMGPVLAQDNANFFFDDTTHALTITGPLTASNISGTNTGDVTLTAVGSSPSANGASLSGQILTLQPADGTHPGLLTSGAQTIGGAKTFSSSISASNFSGSSSGTNTGDVTLGTANGLSLVGQVLSYDGIGNAANKTLSNLTSPTAINQSLVPNAPNTFNLGSSTNMWGIIMHSGERIFNAGQISTEDAGLRYLTIQSENTGIPLPSGLTNLGVAISVSGNAGLANNNALAIYSINDATSNTNQTGDIHLETGNKTAGTGNSGSVFVRTGTSSGGTRGKLVIQDGSQGTAGYVWTSTDTVGSGHWAPNSGGSIPAPVEILSSYTSNFVFNPASFVGNASDLDQTNLSIILGSTDTTTAANSTSDVYVLAGDNTAASSTGNGGGVILNAGSIITGSGTGGLIDIYCGNGDSSDGGSVTVRAGASNTGAGGLVNISGGATTAGVQNAGNVQINGGTSAGAMGGQVLIVGGSGSTNGNITMQTLSGAAIQFQDGSEGTAGYIWTSTDTVGSGHWAPASGGTPSLTQNHIFVGNASNVATDVVMSGDVSIVASGATTIANGAITNAKVNAAAAIDYSKLNLSSSIVNADIASGAAIAFSKLAALTSAHILVGNGSNVATNVAVSGDISLSNTGSTAIVATTNSSLTTLSALSLPGSQVTGNISGNAANVTGIVAIANGGTGSATQNFVDLSTNQTVAGEKTLSNALGLTQISTPSTPSAGFNKIYAKSDGQLYILNSAGVETAIAPGLSGTGWDSSLTFTPNSTGFGTISGSSFFSRRVGDTLEVIGSFTNGTPGAGDLYITLPFNTDTSKYTSRVTVVGHLQVLAGGVLNTTGSQTYLSAGVDSSNPNQVFFANNSSSTTMTTATGVSNLNAGVSTIHFSVPISGWTASNGPAITHSEIWVTDSDVAPNSYGTSNTFVRRFLTTTTNIGFDVTYTDDASLGGYFTINSSGVYSISYIDVFSGDTYQAIVKNGTQGSTAIQSITTATEAIAISSTGAGSDPHSVSVTTNLSNGDKIWFQSSGGTVTASSSLRAFISVRIIRIA